MSPALAGGFFAAEHTGKPHSLDTLDHISFSSSSQMVSRCPVTHMYLTVDMITQVVEELLGHIQPSMLDSAR